MKRFGKLILGLTAVTLFCGIVTAVLFIRRLPPIRLTKQDKQLTLMHDGIEREFILHIPDAIDDTMSYPLVFVVHGGGGTARVMLRLTDGRFNELADDAGFFVVYPQGVDKNWNVGRSKQVSTAGREAVDDLGFFLAMIDELSQEYPIDTQRVFATGISAGGFMSLRLGCEASAQFRAITAVTASIPTTQQSLCDHETNVGLMVINGTADPMVPYEGGQVVVFEQERGEIISTAETIALWAKNGRCAPTPQERQWPDHDPDDGTTVTVLSYDDCELDTAVKLIQINGGGHTWPGGWQYLSKDIIGATSQELNAADTIWEFFNQFE